jgi:hypothetical protein
MTKKLIAAAIAATFSLTAPALAHGDASSWKAPVNGTVSAIIMQDGDVMMKVQVPPMVFGAISRDMKTNTEYCHVQQINPGAKNSMILICHPA